MRFTVVRAGLTYFAVGVVVVGRRQVFARWLRLVDNDRVFLLFPYYELSSVLLQLHTRLVDVLGK